jgi:hypothetical protein
MKKSRESLSLIMNFGIKINKKALFSNILLKFESILFFGTKIDIYTALGEYEHDYYRNIKLSNIA